MKKLIFSALILSGSLSIYAQSGQKWATNGNAASSSDFIGTTNNEALVLKANNTVGLKVKPNGELVFKSLDLNSSAPAGLVLTSGQGVISRLDFNGATNKVLFSNGTWGNLPAIPATTWVQNQNNVYYTAGRVGIGTANPFVQLDVIGDARISNNLYVGGGIVITDKVNATTEIKGWDMKVDNDLNVESSTRLKGATRIDQGFTFDGVNGISKTVSGTGNQVLKYGSKISAPTAVPCALGPGTIHQFDGSLQIYDPSTLGAAGLLNIQTWANGSSIDASAGGATGSGQLLLNYFCGNSIGICNGPNGGNVGICNTANGGIVSLGKNTELGFPVQDLNTALNVSLPAGITTAFKISNPALTTVSKTIFEVKTTGQVFIGTRRPNGIHANALLGVDGEAQFTAVYVNQNSWADYVFKPGYQLPSLNEVEAFYTKHHHLPEVPTEKEILENGVNVGDMSAALLKKVEELTLYTVELNKQMLQLQEKNNGLQKQLDSLKK